MGDFFNHLNTPKIIWGCLLLISNVSKAAINYFKESTLGLVSFLKSGVVSSLTEGVGELFFKELDAPKVIRVFLGKISKVRFKINTSEKKSVYDCT